MFTLEIRIEWKNKKAFKRLNNILENLVAIFENIPGIKVIYYAVSKK